MLFLDIFWLLCYLDSFNLLLSITLKTFGWSDLVTLTLLSAFDTVKVSYFSNNQKNMPNQYSVQKIWNLKTVNDLLKVSAQDSDLANFFEPNQTFWQNLPLVNIFTPNAFSVQEPLKLLVVLARCNLTHFFLWRF